MYSPKIGRSFVKMKINDWKINQQNDFVALLMLGSQRWQLHWVHIGFQFAWHMSDTVSCSSHLTLVHTEIWPTNIFIDQETSNTASSE